MKISLLGIFSRITKKIPYFKGYGTFIKFINNFFLNIGVDPIKLSYFKDGTKSNERKWKNGQPHGKWKAWKNDGTISSEKFYKRGKRVLK